MLVACSTKGGGWLGQNKLESLLVLATIKKGLGGIGYTQTIIYPTYYREHGIEFKLFQCGHMN